MSVATGATKGWWGSRENTMHSMEVPWQHCEWEPTCKQPPTSTVTLKEVKWKNLPDPIPTMYHFL